MSRNDSVLAQCPDWSVTSKETTVSGPTPSPCISSIRRARLSDRSNRADLGARSGFFSSSAATSCDNSNRLRRGFAGRGRSLSAGSLERSVISRMRGSSLAGPASKTSRTRRCILRVLTNRVTRASVSTGWSAMRESKPLTRASAKSTPGGNANSRGEGPSMNI